MGKCTDLTGQKFGQLTVIKRGENDKYNKARWWCKCDCGNPKLVLVISNNLTNGNTKSCGCLHIETSTKNGRKNKKYNRYDLSGEYGIGWTSNTNEEFYFDLEDYDKIKDYCWLKHIDNKNYITICTRDCKANKIICLHQLITGKNNQDHINRNTFDNRKCNLRDSTQDENVKNRTMQRNNTSGVIGVYWHKKRKKWSSMISINKKQTCIYNGDSKEEAIVARLKAEKEYYGEFAPQQHLYEQYGIV